MRMIRVEQGSRAAVAYLVAGCVLASVYYALPEGTAQTVVYEGLGLATVALIVVGVRRHRPRATLPWLLFGDATLFFVIGDILFDAYPDAASPSVADGFYLAGYPLLAAGLVLLIVHAGGHHRSAAIGEASIATLAFALFQWVFLVQPALHGEGSLAARVVYATYPAGDVVLLAGFAGFFVSAAWRKPAFLFLVAAVAAFLVGDDIYALAPEGYTAGSQLDITWMLSYVLFGVAALHPSMRDLSEPRREPTLRVSSWRILLLTAAILGPVTILLVQHYRGRQPEIPAVFAAAVLISALVVWRLTAILRALERLRVREREARNEAVAAREQLARQNELLREADRMKDEFVALISHDLRTPLTSIIGYTELALEEDDGSPPLGAERRSYLEVVSRGSERLLRLVDDLLFVARLQAGTGLELQPAELDLAAVAEQAVLEATPRAQAKNLRLRFSRDGAVPAVADRGRIFQLLDNLIANAIKFTPEGGLVDVSAEAVPGGAVLEVRDTGIGLSDDDAQRLFERFFRSKRANAAQIPGTGLGLFISRAIAEAHGGRISAHPRPEGGTVFRIELPSTAPQTPADGGAELVA